jgi:two-component system OmpR family sensor kinase/two-component system sensor histidine kinase BaeS
MTFQRREWRGQPPWWPDNEPWPPSPDKARRWRHGRSRFVRRVFIIFAFTLFLSAVGAASLLSRLFGAYERTGGPPVLLIGSIIILGVLLAGRIFAGMRRLAVPLGDLVEAANRVADGDFTARITTAHGPESVQTVAKAFNTMTSRLAAQEQQRRNLMADIAHELRTPLSVIQGRLEGLVDGVYPRDDATIGEVIDETKLLARLVDDLRTLANAESGTLTLRKESTDPAALIQEVVRSFADDAQSKKISIRTDLPPDLPIVTIDPLRIREVLVNLISNAVRSTPEAGDIVVAARVESEHVAVSVTDSGPGIAPQDLPKIFDRFYKGATSRGSGLGLTIARDLIHGHGGAIRAENVPGNGAMLTFTIPNVSA